MHHLRGLPILLTARDVGGAGHIVLLAEGLRAAGAAVELVGQGAAARYFARQKAPFIEASNWLGYPLTETSAGDLDPHLIIGVRERLQANLVKAVICGVSAFHSDGIDELVMMAATQAGIQSFAMQDFWGDVKRVNGAGADHYLVIDDVAAKLTRERTSAKIKVIGSAKHSHFGKLDLPYIRTAARLRLGINREDFVIGFFGQDLFRLTGYPDVLKDVVSAADATGARLVYRPHPREGDEAIAASLSIFEAASVKPILVQDGPIEEPIAISDAVVSCFSTVGLDANHLTRSAPCSGPLVIYADYPADIARYWRQHGQIQSLPLVDTGVALGARNGRELAQAVAGAKRTDQRATFTANVKRRVPDPSRAVGIAVRYVAHVLASHSAAASSAEGHG